MARPKKNRTSEYAALLAEALAVSLSSELRRAIAAAQDAQRREIAALRSEVRRAMRRLEAMRERRPKPRTKLGRWVPGGPGRPPKDAAERVAAFAKRRSKGKR
ncbi:MAG: hypothetical protein IT384_01205 [Deltaproteobacteria bacterium]|nr:hypothetical protein [Deltaproteobacteria bacterium]